MAPRAPGLGTQLRHLIELLDGAVGRHYAAAGLSDYRPRFTPVVRVLHDRRQATIKEIAALAAVTHSAASQTVAEMVKAGFVETVSGSDARERLVSLSGKARAMLPDLQRLWQATDAAATALDAELSYPLARLLQETVVALDRCSFDARIASQKDENAD